MRFIIVLGIIAYVLWLIYFRSLYFLIKYKRNKSGIPLLKQMEKQEIVDFLKQIGYPDLKAVYINEASDIVIEGKHGEYKVTTEDNILYITKKGAGKKQAMYFSEEAECIKQYIQKTLDTNAPINAYQTYKNLKNARKKTFIMYYGIIIAFIIFVVYFVTNYLSYSNMIKESYLEPYTNEKTIGQAFEDFFGNTKWTNYKNGSQKMVDFTGECMLEDEKAHITITFIIFGDAINGGEFQLHSVKIDGKEVPDLVSVALFSKVFDIDVSDINSSETQSSVGDEYLYNSSSNNIGSNSYIDDYADIFSNEEYNEPNIDYNNDSFDSDYYDENTFYQPDTLTPEKAKQIVKNYFELPDDAVTYMPEYNFGADKTYQYAFRLRLPMTDGSDGLYTMWILVEDTTEFMYWGTWDNDYLIPSGEPFN